MKDFLLVMGTLYINTESGSGTKYKASNPKQIAFAVQEYLTNYCMEEAK